MVSWKKPRDPGAHLFRNMSSRSPTSVLATRVSEIRVTLEDGPTTSRISPGVRVPTHRGVPPISGESLPVKPLLAKAVTMESRVQSAVSAGPALTDPQAATMNPSTMATSKVGRRYTVRCPRGVMPGLWIDLTSPCRHRFRTPIHQWYPGPLPTVADRTEREGGGRGRGTPRPPGGGRLRRRRQ